MNIKLVQWLLKNQAVLLKIVEVAKGWKNDATYEERWGIVDSIARLVIPLIKAQQVSPLSLLAEDDDAAYSAMSADYAALGIDWKFLSEVLIPLLIAILKTLGGQEAA